ncbi:MAG: DUF2779 domain-containing protein [Bacteroidales bacterium]|nr:DUF2779 domain-containing protein [Bacteroidales bacterium]
MKLFTKSRFKLCLDCPTKLYYQDREAKYDNLKKEDAFLEALAEGGYQVGELAKLYYPDGYNITERGYDIPLEKTNELLKKENVVIFEAAIRYNNFFIRVDILEKKANTINLIEVKSKSYSDEDSDFKPNNPYVQDVAFQTYVMKKAFPQWKINSFLMLADKSKVASINGLNQMFRLVKSNDGHTSVFLNKEMIAKHGIGEPILSKVDVGEVVDEILNGFDDELSFEEKITNWADLHSKEQKIESNLSYRCFNCEFQSDNLLRSGFRECWSKHYTWADDDYTKPKMSEIWNLHYTKKEKLFEEGIFFLEQVEKADLGDFNNTSIELSGRERQWLQVEKYKTKDFTPFIEVDGLRNQMQYFTYPLHFIDFETCMVAIPFYKGQRPYEQIAFQFSHHVMHKTGQVEHKTEFIEIERGKYPNFDFLRALKKALENDEGTIFRYAAHENTVLNQILKQIEGTDIENLPDKDELINFIKSITCNKKTKHEGDRNMVDLLCLVKDYYYHPKMKGSNSIKVVLPAVIESDYIKNKYSQPIGKINITSKNFPDDMVWYRLDENGQVIDPYKLLSPVFNDIIILGDDADEDETVASGGAAMTAFARMQFAEMPENQRNTIIESLKRYCELDTLAMVIIYDYFRNLTGI